MKGPVTGPKLAVVRFAVAQRPWQQRTERCSAHWHVLVCWLSHSDQEKYVLHYSSEFLRVYKTEKCIENNACTLTTMLDVLNLFKFFFLPFMSLGRVWVIWFLL